jgi:hypothetical protein
MGPPLTAGEMQRRWAQGFEGFFWRVDGRPAHYYWITRHAAWLPYVARTFHPQPGDVLILDVYTYPEFRRPGIDTASSIEYLHRARAAGLRRLIALVATWNAPALHVAQERMGSLPVGSLRVIDLVLVRRHLATGLVRLEGDEGFSVRRIGSPPGAVAY